jgi:hypothetical protein
MQMSTGPLEALKSVYHHVNTEPMTQTMAVAVSTVSQRDGTLGLFDQDTRWTDGLLHQAT